MSQLPCMHPITESLHATIELFPRDKQIRFQGQEEVPYILRFIIVQELIAHAARIASTGNYPAKHVHEHGDGRAFRASDRQHDAALQSRSEEHTSELPSLTRISYARLYLTTKQ